MDAKFYTVYNTSSGLWSESSSQNPDRQPRNHLTTEDDADALCGIKGVEWMGSESMTIREMETMNGICKRCMKKAIKITSLNTNNNG